MQRQTQAEKPETLETVRARLVARRSGLVEDETEVAAAVDVASDNAFLLGNGVGDTLVGLVATLLPLVVSRWVLRQPEWAFWGQTSVDAWVIGLAVANLTALAPYRVLRRTIAVGLLLSTIRSVTVTGGALYWFAQRTHAEPFPFVAVVVTSAIVVLQATVLVQAFRKR